MFTSFSLLRYSVQIKNSLRTVKRNIVFSAILLFMSAPLLAIGNGNFTTNGGYHIIPQSEYSKLIAIRDSIGSITGLDTLYEDRLHPNGLPYHIYIPENLEPDVNYPLVIFLHGYTDLSLSTHHGFPKGVWSLPMFQDDHPHILLVPRYRDNNDHWIYNEYRAMFIEMLDSLISELNNNPEQPNIDTTRLYLTGFSQGGMGTWNYIRNYPHKFAAAVPLSGFFSGPQTVEEAEEINHIPIWIFNGDSDNGIEGSRASYNVLSEAEAPDVTFYEYENHGHVIDDFAYFTDGFLDWLFAQSLDIQTSIYDKSTEPLSGYKLYRNYPNPFNPSTMIRYQLAVNSDVKLVVFDMLGREVKTLVREHQNAGNYSVRFDGSGLTSGVYYYQLSAGEYVRVNKMMLVK